MDNQNDIKKVFLGNQNTQEEEQKQERNQANYEIDDFLEEEEDNNQQGGKKNIRRKKSSSGSSSSSSSGSSSSSSQSSRRSSLSSISHEDLTKLPVTFISDDESDSGCTIDLLSSDPLFLVLSQFFMSKESGDNIATILEKLNNNIEKVASRLDSLHIPK